jgi:23S rRNA pseudouridine1911/1915/1917 synthase
MIWTPHILYEDNHYVAISKPAGLSVQQEPGQENAIIPLMQDFIGKRDSKPGKAFIGVLHRLDKNVTGTLLLAKTSKGQERFNELLKEKKVNKYYVAITARSSRPIEGKLNHWIGRAADEFKMQVHLQKKSPQDQEATLYYKIIAQQADQECLLIELMTGRRHQIRAQLAFIGSPILGDQRYGNKSHWEHGIALHATLLSFFHPIKKVNVIIKDIPPAIEGWRPFRARIQDWHQKYVFRPNHSL